MRMRVELSKGKSLEFAADQDLIDILEVAFEGGAHDNYAPRIVGIIGDHEVAVGINPASAKIIAAGRLDQEGITALLAQDVAMRWTRCS